MCSAFFMVNNTVNWIKTSSEVLSLNCMNKTNLEWMNEMYDRNWHPTEQVCFWYRLTIMIIENNEKCEKCCACSWYWLLYSILLGKYKGCLLNTLYVLF